MSDMSGIRQSVENRFPMFHIQASFSSLSLRRWRPRAAVSSEMTGLSVDAAVEQKQVTGAHTDCPMSKDYSHPIKSYRKLVYRRLMYGVTCGLPAAAYACGVTE